MHLSRILGHEILFHAKDIQKYGLISHFNGIIMHFYAFTQEYEIEIEETINIIGQELINFNKTD